MTKPYTISFRRRHLPHWRVADHPYFVTIRLKGSLPKSVIKNMEEERKRLMQSHHSNEERERLRRTHFNRIEAILDTARTGPAFLKGSDVAGIIFDAFNWLQEQKGWQIYAATVMPNHLHLLLRHHDGRTQLLNKDLGVLKGFTAREANKLLDRTGQPFWMDENFDHWCRTDMKTRASVRYIAMNPVKAGLTKHWTDWPWTKVSQAFLPDLHDL